MFGSTILDTVIAMSFVFLLVGLFVTTINEMIAAALRSRAKWLRWGVERLLGKAYADKLFEHPLIQSLSPAPDKRGFLAKGITGPSYIPSRSFANVLLDIVAKEAPAGGMRQAIASLPDPTLSKTLTVLLDDAKDDVETFKQDIEIWFNNGMDRVGGWYKRQSQFVVGIISVVITLALNVDALLILQQLNSQAGLRDALVAQAKTFAERPPVAINVTTPPTSLAAPEKSLDNAGTVEEKKGTTTAALTADKSIDNLGPTEKKFGTTVGDFATVQAQLSALNLPIGWFCDKKSNWLCGSSITPVDESVANFRRVNFLMLPWSRDHGDILGTISFHLAGWILTALAASLGAPFWFDTLNTFMSIRSAGKAPEEKPKPPKEVPAPLAPGQTPQPPTVANQPHQ